MNKHRVCCICDATRSKEKSFSNQNRIEPHQNDLLSLYAEHFNIPREHLTPSYDKNYYVCNGCYRDFYDIDFKKGVSSDEFFEGYTKEELIKFCKEKKIENYSGKSHKKLALHIYEYLNEYEKYSQNIKKRGRKRKRGLKKEKKVTPKKQKMNKEEEEEKKELEDGETDEERDLKYFQVSSSPSTNSNILERISKLEKTLACLGTIISLCDFIKEDYLQAKKELEELKKSVE